MRLQSVKGTDGAANRAAGFTSVLHGTGRRACVMAWLLLGVLAGPAWGQLSSEDIAALRKQGEKEGWTFTVGENEATGYALEDLCGYIPPSEAEMAACSRTLASSRDLPAYFDWREFGEHSACTDVRSQGGCGACWAFAAMGTVESALLIHQSIAADLSEQWLISCTNAGDCDGGSTATAYNYIRCAGWLDYCGLRGAVTEAAFPYEAWNYPCEDCPYENPRLYCIDDYGCLGTTPTVAQIKQAIVDYGPVSVGIHANNALQAYTGGVFEACEDEALNHGVVLVGWDDSLGAAGVWIMRNSWGSGWGIGGYCLIPYGCSRVGRNACYVDYHGGDCNGNSVPDGTDISGPTSEDCNGNEVPDECDIGGITSADCNSNDVPDECDIAGPTSEDCNDNIVPDECEPQEDCNENEVQDICDIAGPTSEDCNENVVPDECDIAEGTSLDGNDNSVPDECEDCNGNEIPDVLETDEIVFQSGGAVTEDTLDTTAPVAQDMHLTGQAWLRQFTVYYRSIGSTPGVMMVRFFEGNSGGSQVPVYPGGLIGEYDCGQLQWTGGALDWKITEVEPPLWLSSDLWMEVEIEQDAGVILREGPAATGSTLGWVYDRNAGEMLPDCPLYMGLRMAGLQCVPVCMCGDINQQGGPVDLTDFATFALCFGLGAANPPDCDADAFTCSDLNGDATVDLIDFATFALTFGLISTNSVPNCP